MSQRIWYSSISEVLLLAAEVIAARISVERLGSAEAFMPPPHGDEEQCHACNYSETHTNQLQQRATPAWSEWSEKGKMPNALSANTISVLK
jgi:hypothetical protein